MTYTLNSGAQGGVVAYGEAPNVPLTDGDRSLHWRGAFGTVEEPGHPLYGLGRFRLELLDVGAGVHKFAAVKSFAGGSITAIGTTTVAVDTTYDLYATWDRDTATVAIIVDGVEEDTAEDAASYVNTPNLPTYSIGLPPNSWCTELAAWDTVVSAVAPFSPTDIAVLQTWYDASDTATITDAGAGAVSQWDDKSGNGRHLTQATSARRPTTGVTTLNSLNVLDFAGDDSLVDAVSGWGTFWRFLHDASGVGGKAEVWAVLKPGTTANPGVSMYLCATWAGAVSTRGALVFYDDSGGGNDRLTAYVARGTNPTTVSIGAVSADGLISANSFHMIEWITDVSNATASERSTFIVDEGTPSKTNTSASSVLGGDPAQGLVVGALSAAATSGGLIGSVAELLTFDGALTNDERTAMRTYLTTKWGV